MTVALFAAAPVLAESPFVGTWKMNASKSTFAGDTMTYDKTATGYHFTNGSTIAYDFGHDGKPYPTVIPGRTTTWMKASDGGWDIVFIADGKPLTKAHRTLSADGSTMTTTYEEYRGDGTTVHESDIYTRVSGKDGLVGKWRSVKVDAASDTLMISPVSSMTYKIEYPQNKVVLTPTLDGAPDAGCGTDRSGRGDGQLQEGRQFQVDLFEHLRRQDDG